VIDKPGKGAFYQTDLELMLKNRGIEKRCSSAASPPRFCVNTTVREANDPRLSLYRAPPIAARRTFRNSTTWVSR